MEVNNNFGEDDGDHREEFNKDVDGGAGGILKGVANGIADDGGFVGFRVFAAEVAGFNVFFGVVPDAAGVSHKDGH